MNPARGLCLGPSLAKATVPFSILGQWTKIPLAESVPVFPKALAPGPTSLLESPLFYSQENP